MPLAATTLLVEDEREVSDSYMRSFEDEGLRVDLASTWEDALAMFRIAGYDLVIADYNLKGSQHGLQLLLAMKRMVPHSRLILISGAMSPKAEQLAKTIDFVDGFYPKGMGLTEILLREVNYTADHASDPTDWRKFGAGYLADPARGQPELEEIDKALRADVARNA